MTLEREKTLQVKEMPSEGRNLAEQRESHRARRGRACLPGKVPGRRRTRTHQASSPSQRKRAGGARAPLAEERHRRVRGAGGAGHVGGHQPGWAGP